MKTPANTVRLWLVENGYPKILELIELVEAGWRANGRKTRRNWWDVLAGHKDGSPWIIEGHKFPILRAAQLRKGWKATPDSICQNKREKILPIIPQNRWQHLRKGAVK